MGRFRQRQFPQLVFDGDFPGTRNREYFVRSQAIESLQNSGVPAQTSSTASILCPLVFSRLKGLYVIWQRVVKVRWNFHQAMVLSG